MIYSLLTKLYSSTSIIGTYYPLYGYLYYLKYTRLGLATRVNSSY